MPDEEIPQYSEAAIATQRRSYGVKLHAICDELNMLANPELGKLTGTPVAAHLPFLTDKERAAIDKVEATLNSCQRNLSKLSERLRSS